MKAIELEEDEWAQEWAQMRVKQHFEAVRWLPSLLKERRPKSEETAKARQHIYRELHLCLVFGQALEVQGRLVDPGDAARFEFRAEAIVRAVLQHLDDCDLES
jgi:hypothetical protein